LIFKRGNSARVVEEEDERARHVSDLAEFLQQMKVLEEGLRTIHRIFVDIWHQVQNDANIPENLKLDFWKHETTLLTDIINKQGLFGLEATVKEVSKAIRAAILKALEEAE